MNERYLVEAALRIYVARKTVFYMLQSIFLALLLSLFGVFIMSMQQASVDDLGDAAIPVSCQDASDPEASDAKRAIDSAFVACFIVHGLDFVNAAFLAPAIVILSPLQQVKQHDLDMRDLKKVTLRIIIEKVIFPGVTVLLAIW